MPFFDFAPMTATGTPGFVAIDLEFDHGSAVQARGHTPRPTLVTEEYRRAATVRRRLLSQDRTFAEEVRLNVSRRLVTEFTTDWQMRDCQVTHLDVEFVLGEPKPRFVLFI